MDFFITTTLKLGCLLIISASSFAPRHSFGSIAAGRESWLNGDHGKVAAANFLNRACALSGAATPGDDINDLLNTVSEAEALLACRSYLQRKNRLNEWSNRRATRIEILEEAKESDSVGFFWENPDELVYYDRKRRPRYRLLKNSTAGNMDETNDASLSSSTAVLSPSSFGRQRRKRRRPYDNENIMAFDADVWENAQEITEDETTPASYFRIDEETPSKSHIRRSEASKKNFADPDWKAAWYERRWGKHRKLSTQEKKNRIMHQRVLPLAALLSHPELAAMDEDEIAEAIKTYREANNKRSTKVRQAVERRRNEFDFPAGTPFDLNTTVINRDSLFRVESDTLLERQEKRAETARRAYQTRLKKQKAKKNTRSGILDSTPFFVKGRAPDLAMQRIHSRLFDPKGTLEDASTLKELRSDLRRVMSPTRLSRRTPLLHRMLTELFGLRGKCIPNDAGGFTFLTTAPIQDVANLIDQKLAERIDELSRID